MVLKEIEPKEHIKPVLPQIQLTADVAEKKANSAVDQLKSNVEMKQLNLAAIEYQKNENKLVAGLGRAAETFLKKNNLEDVKLALGMAELLTQTGELKAKYTEAWKHDFENYISTFLKKIDKGLTDEDRKEAYLTMSVVVNNIGNAARLEKIDYFAERAQNPKWREETRNFVTGAIEGAKQFYDQERFEEGDRVLSYLGFFTDTILKQGIKGKEGRAAVEQAVLLQLGGESEKAEEMFKRGLQQYKTTIVVRQLWEQYAKLESNYNMISDAYGKSEKAEGILAEAKKALDNRQVNVAVKKMNEFVGAMNKHVEKNMLAKLDEIKNDLGATAEVMEEYKKRLLPYASEFPEQVKGIVKKIENVTNDSERLLGELKDVKKDYESGKVDEKKTEKFFSRLREFSAKKKDAIGTVSAATLLFGNIEAYKQYVQALKASNVEPVRKETVIESLNKAAANMKKSLDLLIEEGTESKRAKEQYERGIHNTIGAIALLDLERLPYQEEEKKLTSLRQSFTIIYDKCVGAEASEDVWKLNETLHNGLRAVLATDDKLFATKEADLQQEIMTFTKYLSNHYIAKITGKKEGLLSPATVKQYKDAIARDSKTLAEKIERAETINNALKIAASYIHPAIFIATTVEMAVKEYEITNKISWSTGLMLAASALATRGVIGLKGFETASLGAKIAKTTLNTVELGIGATLAVHGGYTTYQMFKEGRYEEGLLNLAMFALPLFHTAVRKPLMTYMGKKIPEFRKLTAEFWEETALNTNLKKFGLPETKELVKTGLEKTKGKIKAVGELPIKIKLEGAEVPLVPMPFMAHISTLPKIEKIAPKPVTMLEILKSATTGEKNKYAKAVGGKPGENFFETVKLNGGLIKSRLKEVRNTILYKDKSEIYKVLSGEAEGAEKVLMDLFPGERAGAIENPTFGCLILDKGKTWALNNIGPTFGDTGLYVYFQAVKNVEEKIRKAGYDIRLEVKMSEKGDEMLIVFTGKKVKEAMAKYTELLREELSSIAGKMGFEGVLKDAITAFSATEVETVATLKDDKMFFTAEIRGKTKTMKLETLLAVAEASEKLIQMEKKGINVETLWKFLDLPEIELPAAAKEIKSVETLKIEDKLDYVISFRVDVEPGTKLQLWELTNVSGKGVMNVDNGIIGPSVLNLLGHPVTDVFSVKYHLELIKNLKKAGVEVETYSHGPMSIGIIGKVDPKILDKVLAETNKAMAKDKDLAALGVSRFEAYVGKNKDAANYEIIKRVVGYDIPKNSYEQLKNMVTILHMKPEGIIKMLEGKKIKPEMINLLKSIKEKEVVWVRNPEDLVHYLSKSMEKNEIIKLLDELGIALQEKTNLP